MSIVQRLKKYLEEKKVEFSVINHPPLYTAQELAGFLHVKGRYLAKVVMLKSLEKEDKFIMAVVPAPCKVDLKKIKEISGNVRIATEDEFRTLFPDCEPGAMPPFGNLYGIDVLMDNSFRNQNEIYFRGGSHFQAVRMRTDDYIRLVNPLFADLSIL